MSGNASALDLGESGVCFHRERSAIKVEGHDGQENRENNFAAAMAE